MILRKLSEYEISVYRHPIWTLVKDRRSTLIWPRQIILDDEPTDVNEIINNYADWLPESTAPKLFINAVPSAILVGARREFCRTWSNQIEVTVNGLHYIQEDSPDEIGIVIANWIGNIS